jgi:F420-non-reducing hydrogenase iron-sulfur subunit
MSYQPKIVGFLCNWCSYTGADLAGVSRYQYPPNLRIVRVMCSGRVHPAHILKAFREGADGVLVAGCHPPNDCHYISGNLKAQRRVALLRRFMIQMGIDERRLRLEWVSAAEGERFAKIVTEFTSMLIEMGPSPIRGTVLEAE